MALHQLDLHDLEFRVNCENGDDCMAGAAEALEQIGRAINHARGADGFIYSVQPPAKNARPRMGPSSTILTFCYSNETGYLHLRFMCSRIMVYICSYT